MPLLDVLACPRCLGGFARDATPSLVCIACGASFPLDGGVPILFPEPRSSEEPHEGELLLRPGYEPPIRQIFDSLPRDRVILDVGSGNRSLDDPRIVRMDAMRTPWVDVVGDAHRLPFRSGSLAVVHASAVFEHLRRPFDAAREILRVLAPGGHALVDCNFVFPFHGYPAVYFNASAEGLRELFRDFREVQVAVAPWQMPSFALQAFIAEYAPHLQADGAEEGELKALLARVYRMPLQRFDARFSQSAAMRIAAATTYFGAKEGSLVPDAVMDEWRREADLQRRYPRPWSLLEGLDGAEVDNLMRWSQREGRSRGAIAAALDSVVAFRKRE